MVQDDIVIVPAGGVASRVVVASRTDAMRQWYLVGILFAIYVLNSIDRGALNLIVNPLREDLQISDVQTSLLLGLSFAALYSILSVPAGYLADIMSRRLLLGGAIFFWSCMAAMCGFAGNYWQLFAGRVGLGVGEAALPPTAYSLLRDGVRPEHRSRAFSIYHTGSAFGAGLGALIGGTLFALGSRGAFESIPLLGHLKPWQLVIVLPGLCGIPISLLLLTVREPHRAKATTGTNTPTFGELFRYVGQNWRVYAPLFGAVIFGSMGMSGWGGWFPAALGRTWGLSTPEIGHMTGSLSLLILPVNALTVGYVMDRVSKGGTRPHASIWVAIAVGLMHLAAALTILLMPSIPLMWAAYALSLLVMSATGMAGTIGLAMITPSRMMGKATSFYFLLANLVGLALGPTVVALVSRGLFDGKLAIVHAMMLCFPILVGCNTALLGVFAHQLRRWHPANSNIGLA